MPAISACISIITKRIQDTQVLLYLGLQSELHSCTCLPFDVCLALGRVNDSGPRHFVLLLILLQFLLQLQDL